MMPTLPGALQILAIAQAALRPTFQLSRPT
jgi:hypothetical protein